MTNKIQFKRGLKSNLPITADEGMPLWCTDTKELYIGTGTSVEKVGSNSNSDTYSKEEMNTMFENINGVLNEISTKVNIIESACPSKYGMTLGNFLGDVDENGVLQFPKSGEFIGTGIIEVGEYALLNRFGGIGINKVLPVGLSSAIFPDLKRIKAYGLGYFCTYSSDLETASFPELEEVADYGLSKAFYNNENLISVSFPKLKKITGQSSLASICEGCKNLESIDLNSLEYLSESCLYYAFRNTKLKTLSFPSLKKENFEKDLNFFNYMLQNVNDCTVHFPLELEDYIVDFSSVISGFGGKNTSILFDLKKAQLNFITDYPDSKIYTNGKESVETTCFVPIGTASYAIYSANNNLLYIGELVNLVDGENVNIELNTEQTLNKITLAIGISGLNVKFEFNGTSFNAVEELNGNYVINTPSQSGTISYFIDGGDSYTDEMGNIVLNGNDITLPIEIKEVNLIDFERPNLTSNEELGGDSFAVWASSSLSSSTQAFHAVDENTTSTYWWNNEDKSQYVLYNPQALKISNFNITFRSNSASFLPSEITIQGSNDNVFWDDLVSVGYEETKTRNIEVNSDKYYKYHRFKMKKKSTYIGIYDIQVIAIYKEAK